MKKNYNQPIVNAEQVQLTALMLGASPAGIGAGTGNGTTGDIGGGGSTPIPGE